MKTYIAEILDAEDGSGDGVLNYQKTFVKMTTGEKVIVFIWK